ncbi:MAG: formate/nitrite transporter family protein [Clostridiales bacterium]|nr:formate/nitrite transporter family protein [Clostridiales bacterium]
MYQDTYSALCNAARAKATLLERNPLGFFVSSMVAGMFITFGSLLAMTVGGLLTAAGFGAPKLLAALAFSAALSLVITAGCELFTGNNLTMTAASLAGQVKWSQTLTLWAVCWLGNLAGSWLTIVLYTLSGAGSAEAVAAYFAASAAAKVALSPLEMVVRGILCNICVCLAVWCSFRLQNECAKLVMTVWCILIFMTCGFEHSIANMSIIGVALLNPMGESISLVGYITNLLLVTVGNCIGGGGFVALPYFLISREAKS